MTEHVDTVTGKQAKYLNSTDGDEHSYEMSIGINNGGRTRLKTLDNTDRVSQVLNLGFALVLPSVDCFIRSSSGGSTVSVPVLDGAVGDIPLQAGVMVRITGIKAGTTIVYRTATATGETILITDGA